MNLSYAALGIELYLAGVQGEDCGIRLSTFVIIYTCDL